MNKTKRVLTILEYLMIGGQVEMCGRTYLLQNDLLFIKAVKYEGKSKKRKECLLGVTLSLDGFLRMCEAIPEEEVFIYGANIALTKHNSDKRE